MAHPVMEDIQDSIPPVSNGDAHSGQGCFEVLRKRYLKFLSLFDAAGWYHHFDRPVSQRGHKLVPLRECGRSDDLHEGDGGSRRNGLTRRRADEVLTQIAGGWNVGMIVVVAQNWSVTRVRHDG